MRISFAVRTRVPGEGSSAQGKSGPKAQLKGEVDGQQVKIPALTTWSDGGTHYAIHSRAMAMPVGVSEVSRVRKSTWYMTEVHRESPRGRRWKRDGAKKSF